MQHEDMMRRKVRFIDRESGTKGVGRIIGCRTQIGEFRTITTYEIVCEDFEPINIFGTGIVAEIFPKIFNVNEHLVFNYEPDLRDCIKEAIFRSENEKSAK